MFKKPLLFVFFIAFITLSTGCGGTKAPNASNESTGAAISGGHISVLSLQGDISSMTQDQVNELQRVKTWMDRDHPSQYHTSNDRLPFLRGLYFQ